MLISGDSRNVAVRGRDGRLHLMRTGNDVFLLKEWLAADADARLPTDPSLGEGVSCDDAGCVVPMADGRLIALSWRADALADDCARTALVVTVRQAPRECAAAVVDRERLSHQGALALRREGPTLAVDAVRPNGIYRPWWPGAADASEFDTSLTPRPPSSRTPDATPPEADQQQDD